MECTKLGNKFPFRLLGLPLIVVERHVGVISSELVDREVLLLRQCVRYRNDEGLA